MALFCLADSLDDLRNRLGNIVVGINENKDFIYYRKEAKNAFLMPWKRAVSMGGNYEYSKRIITKIQRKE